jgi:DNA transposition AAA+ family ATPase
MADAALKNVQVHKKTEAEGNRRIDLWAENFPFQDPDFIETSISKKIWGMLNHCEQTPDMGLAIGSSGLGKTRAVQQFKREKFFPIIVPCSITTRSMGAFLQLLAKETGCGGRSSNYDNAEDIIRHLTDSPRLLIFDDAHFLKWELFEFARSIYDRSGSGVVFLGQEVLYDKMLGNRKSYVWDQLTSRIGIHQRLEAPTAEDVELVCRKVFPDLDAKCLEYLTSRATGPGKLRVAVKLLGKAIQAHTRKGISLDVKLLKDIDELLSFKGGWL